MIGTNGSLTNFTSAVSTDGVNWTTQLTSTAASPSCVISNGSIYVMTCGAYSTLYSAGNGIYSSTDGLNWTQQVSNSTVNFNSIAYSSSLGLFIAAGTGTSATAALTNTYYTSPDGTTWTLRTFPVTTSWIYGVWNGTNFVIYDSTNSYIYYSSDGVNWTQGSNLVNLTGMCSKTVK
jgi:hypothetical protein